jgi:hypothetical protein
LLLLLSACECLFIPQSQTTLVLPISSQPSRQYLSHVNDHATITQADGDQH